MSRDEKGEIPSCVCVRVTGAECVRLWFVFFCYCCILCARSNMHVLLRDDCKLMLLLPTPSPLPPPRLQVFIFRIHPCGILCVAQNKTEPKINAKKDTFRHSCKYMDTRVYGSPCVPATLHMHRFFRFNVSHGHSRKHTDTLHTETHSMHALTYNQSRSDIA